MNPIDGTGVDAHLERALLLVPMDGKQAVAAAGREREAPEEGEDPVAAEHDWAPSRCRTR
jgi:hypothetical protein